MGQYDGLLRPMLAVSRRSPFDSPDYLFEPKWDGYRCLVYVNDRVSFISRNGLDMTEKYGRRLKLSCHIEGREVVLDGELLALDASGTPSFNLLKRLGGRMVYAAFDILRKGGADVMDRPLLERKRMLSETVIPGGDVFITDGVREQGTAAYEAAVSLGLEGIVAKHVASPYLPGIRSPYWIKIRHTKTLDAVIVGYSVRDGQVTSVALGLPRPSGEVEYIGSVGAGIGAEQSAHILKTVSGLAAASQNGVFHVRPEVVCEVSYLEFTDSGRLRQPVFKRLRADKTVRDLGDGQQ
ncbi:MAG: hypothetical protein AB1497_12310 [Bacillota bacterium]